MRFNHVGALLIAVLCYSTAASQNNIGINNSTPDASAILDIESTDRGVLIPRMTTVQRQAISSPAEGLLVFDLTTSSFWYYGGGIWRPLEGTEWSLTGNAGTVDGTNFIGTTDGVPLTLKANNLRQGYLNPFYNNIFFGTEAGAGGSGGVYLGYQAGKLHAAGDNTIAIGYQAGANNNTGTDCIFIGLEAGLNYTVGHNNIAIGSHALRDPDASHTYVIAIGNEAGGQLMGSTSNVLIGNFSGHSLNGDHNICLGRAGENINGSYNVAIGSSCATNGAPEFSVLIGRQAAQLNSGPKAVAIGYQAGQQNAGIESVIIGSQACNSSGQGTIAIGALAAKNGAGDGDIVMGYNSFSDNLLFSGSFPNVIIGTEAAVGTNLQFGGNVYMGFRSGSGSPYHTNDENIALGAYAGASDPSNVLFITRTKNIMIGSYAGYTLGTNSGASNSTENIIIGNYTTTPSTLLEDGGYGNIMLGEGAGRDLKLGDFNIAIGAGANIVTNNNDNDNCIAIGNGASITSPANIDVDNAVAIGKLAVCSESNSMIIGNPLQYTMQVGINVSDADYELEVGGTTSTTSMRVEDGTQLGQDAPVIRMKKLTGTIAATQGTSISLSHGITDQSKILAVDVHVEYAANYSVPNGYTLNNGFEFDYYITPTAIVIWPVNGNSINLLNDPVRVLITYEL
ncbi:MAG: hypothetical protein KDC12_09485 [Flavobacteriales bacterium]|nr:hypothetical protein [Flavobacteriales bacterium]